MIPQLSPVFSIWRGGVWHDIPSDAVTARGMVHTEDGGHWSAVFEEEEGLWRITLSVDAPFPTKLRMLLSAKGVRSPFHLIPCNIYGDNNASLARIGEYPLLTEAHPGEKFCSPFWEFRSDRAAMPVSAVLGEDEGWALSVDPYASSEEGTVHTGLVAALPCAFGASLGYTNSPCTFVNRSVAGPVAGDACRRAKVCCRLYPIRGGRSGIHDVIRREYELRHQRPQHARTARMAADALFDAFVRINWDGESGEYVNRHCLPPKEPCLVPWREVTEIGWTGGGVLALALLEYTLISGDLPPERWHGAMDGRAILDRICGCYDPASGLLNDLMKPNAEGSRVNGWWTYYGLCRDCHCAYTVGSAVHSLLKAADMLKKHKKPIPPLWLETAVRVMERVVSLQREDGAFGYTYSVRDGHVLDWEGFAGCWFVPCCAYLYRFTRDPKWLSPAQRAIDFYAPSVMHLTCSGSPMDTWKSVDQEGNLAFVRGCRLMYEETKEKKYLDLLAAGCAYECLWRYGYRTLPDHPPLNSGWNACGGSVTSVSNPHIHPMGVLIDGDLRFLSRETGDPYPLSRAMDSAAWLLQTLELYPDKTGYGAYGVLSERWCPSDGLTVERDSDGAPYSSWFSYNLWAAANALESLCDLIDEG